jgi:tRNA (mo5U34)-methyltransferase
VTPTTLDEQRPTAWINSASLDAFLDPADPGRTVEGHPAPVRAVLLAHG